VDPAAHANKALNLALENSHTDVVNLLLDDSRVIAELQQLQKDRQEVVQHVLENTSVKNIINNF